MLEKRMMVKGYSYSTRNLVPLRLCGNLGEQIQKLSERSLN